MGTERKRVNLVWWGKFDVPETGAGNWRIGAVNFYLERLRREWRLWRQDIEDGDDFSAAVEVPMREKPDYHSGNEVCRYAVEKTHGEVEILPLLADRPVVVRTENPFYVLPGEEMSLIVATPLWIVVETVKPKARLHDSAIVRPSDTWFGPSTMEGEMCYASRVRGRLEREDLSCRPHRAFTAVLLRNEGNESVNLQRISIPVPNLALYEAGDGCLWTQPVTFTLGESNLAGQMNLKQVPPQMAGDRPELVCQPRRKPETPVLKRTLSYLIG